MDNKKIEDIYKKNLVLAKWKVFYVSFIFLLLLAISGLLIYSTIICFKQAFYLFKFNNLDVRNSSIVYYFVAVIMIIIALSIFIIGLWFLTRSIIQLLITRKIYLLFQQNKELKIDMNKMHNFFKINLSKYILNN